MKMNPLGQTDISVSRICLGTMTFGRQNSEADAHAQMDRAFERGVNFIDTAEMYSFPASEETYGRSEEIVGSWMKARGNRGRVVVATKAIGPGGRFPYIRDGNPRLDKKNIAAAVTDSLKRLRTDVIDLYQLHWPDRNANFFSKLGYVHDANELMTPILETLDALTDEVKAGRVRAIGVSNETPWGLMTFLKLADERGLARVASVQNPYNLLNRTYEIGMAEVSHREDCGLLAYSPLAFGALTGKYQGGARPEGARITLFPSFKRYFNEHAVRATDAYLAIANKHGLDPALMAHAFVNTRPFLTANIIGATTLAQLDLALDAEDVVLSDAVLDDIEIAHKESPNPAP